MCATCESPDAEVWVPFVWRYQPTFGGNFPWIVVREQCQTCGQTRPAWRDPTAAEYEAAGGPQPHTGELPKPAPPAPAHPVSDEEYRKALEAWAEGLKRVAKLLRDGGG